ncbi:MAG: hypothetical protein HC806_04220, partial [Anaerolineae bacterium]|nr:hypothetical protein [Anaerolineae bacterium]
MEANTINSEEIVIRATLIMPNYVGNSQLLDAMRHIDDTITTIDGLYTQLALLLKGDIQEAYEYEEKARSFLKEYYYAAIHSISYKQTGEDWAISTFDGYPFASLFNPLLEFNR